MNVTYDSDIQSSPANSSGSDGQQEHLSSQQQSKRSERRLKNAIAYRFAQEQQHKKYRLAFQGWKDSALLNYRGNLVSALNCHQNQLISKAFDGILQYATTTAQFKQKLIVFYYRYLIGRYFSAWKEGHNSNVLNQVDSPKQYIKSIDTLSQVNNNLDSLLSKKSDYFSQACSSSLSNPKINETQSKQHSTNWRQTNQDIETITMQTPKPYLTKRAENFFNKLNRKFQVQKFSLAMQSIRSYVSGSLNRNRNIYAYREVVPTQNMWSDKVVENRNDCVPNKNQPQSQGYRNTSYEGFKYNNLSRESSQMINSRRTQHQQLKDRSLSRSNRRRVPIVEKIELPSFSKKASNLSSANPKQIHKLPQPCQQARTVISKKISYQQADTIEKQINKQRPGSNTNSHQSQIQQQEKAKKRQQEQQQMAEILQNQRKQHQKQLQKEKRKEQHKNRVLAIIAKGKLLQLALINNLSEGSQLFDNYKRLSQETLKKIKIA